MFRKKPIILDCYTSNKSYFINAKPTFGTERPKPTWLEELKTTVTLWIEQIGMHNKMSTVGICPGIRDFMSKAIHFPMWADLDIRMNPDATWSTTIEMRPFDLNVSEHPPEQWKGVYKGQRVALKLENPWKLRCSEPVDFLMMDSHYSSSYLKDKGIYQSPGLTNFKYQVSTNVHLNCPVKPEPYIVTLKFGHPLMSMFPMTERPVELRYHQISVEEWAQMGNHMPATMVGRYYRQQGVKPVK
jgi:hypothetical protein|tara:strand:- start:26778 stop:27506 length:729 start_codon:yes stop_codon:yes gene_type:complete